MRWINIKRLAREYASELLGTTFLIFCVVVFSDLALGASSPFTQHIHSQPLRLFGVGVLMGISAWLFSLTPFGRYSQSHLNPAVSFGFFLAGKMPARLMLGYAVVQMIGGALGAELAGLLCPCQSHEINFALLSPVTGMSPLAAFLCEIAGTFLLAYTIILCAMKPSLKRWGPFIVAFVCGVIVCSDARKSGAGINPARWFGPAFELRDWNLAWIYVGGPLVGSVAAASAYRLPAFLVYLQAMEIILLRAVYVRLIRRDRSRRYQYDRLNSETRFLQ